jgi:hypothetical protein
LQQQLRASAIKIRNDVKTKPRKIDLNLWRLNQCKKHQEMDHRPDDTNVLLDAYYQQLTPFEQRTCDIARDHLGSSFDLVRSNGFLRWIREKK